MNNLSRRSLIRGAAVLPAAGLGLVSTADASSSPKPKFDEIYDVVIIGSGFSGLAAALAAREAGASAAVFEKMAFVGGNSSLSGGMFAVPGSSVQKEQGIKDSPEALMADMERIGLGLGDPQHIRFVCEHAAETFEWTRSYIGVDWNPTLTGRAPAKASLCRPLKSSLRSALSPVRAASWRRSCAAPKDAFKALRSVKGMSSESLPRAP